jgi:hypothetical protein
MLCRRLQELVNPPYLSRFLFTLPYPVLHRIALPVVSEWCQFHARIRVTTKLRVDPGVMLAWRRSAARVAGNRRDVCEGPAV